MPKPRHRHNSTSQSRRGTPDRDGGCGWRKWIQERLRSSCGGTAPNAPKISHNHVCISINAHKNFDGCCHPENFFRCSQRQFHVFSLIFIDFHWFLVIFHNMSSMKINENQWKSMKINENTWNYLWEHLKKNSGWQQPSKILWALFDIQTWLCEILRAFGAVPPHEDFWSSQPLVNPLTDEKESEVEVKDPEACAAAMETLRPHF